MAADHDVRATEFGVQSVPASGVRITNLETGRFNR